VGYVVQDSLCRAPQKTHTPLTTAGDRGLLRSAEAARHAAPIRKDAGGGVEALNIAKVRVAGSSPVVRSRRTGWSPAVTAVEIVARHADGTTLPSM
jgi:hypothetical protein